MHLLRTNRTRVLVGSVMIALGACATDAGLLPTVSGPVDGGVVFAGGRGAGAGKHVVLVAGDEEYRSEEALPMLARILAERHGFRCTVLFSTDAEGRIDPEAQTRIPGIAAVASADVLVLFLRFRELPDEDMRWLVEYVEVGKPVIGIRTATHAFHYERDPDSPYAHWDWRSSEWPGGFGGQVLGETWVAHHGDHGSESTRGVVVPAERSHPVLRGVEDIWGPTDVYAVRSLPDDCVVLVEGEVLAGMEPGSPAVAGAKNDPRMPLAWVRERDAREGAGGRVLCSTIGAATDLESEDLRRLFVNAVYWAAGLEDAIPARADVTYVDPYAPSTFGFGGFRRGVRPQDLARK